jgi:hypothetical protein
VELIMYPLSTCAESAKTQEVVKEYLKALVLTGRLEGANLGHLLSRGTLAFVYRPTTAPDDS